MQRLKQFAIAAVLIAIGLPSAALAQAYKWRDEKGQTVYSDQPPPKNIPPGNILQAPKPLAAALAAAASAPTSGAAVSAPAGKAAAKPAAPKSVAEQEADFKKRQLDSQKKGKDAADKAAEEQRLVAACAGLRQAVAGLEAGQRISRHDEKGERYFINDEQRATEIAKAKQDMAASKC